MNENKLEDLEFFDFDTSLTISESAVDCAELSASHILQGVEIIETISKPCVNFYTYCDSSNDFDLDTQVLLDLPKVIKVKEWLDKFIQKHNKDIQSNE